MDQLKLVKIGIAGVAAVIIGIPLALGSFYTVKSGTQGLVFRNGALVEAVGDGLHGKIPFIDSVTRVDMRTQKSHSPAKAASIDMQNVHTEVALNWHLKGDAVIETYKQFGLDLNEKVIEPRIQEIVKANVAKYKAEELLTKREVVKNGIADGLKSDLVKYNVLVEDIQITNFEFSDEFNKAIEAKQKAEQDAIRARNELETTKVEAEKKIVAAKAEAESVTLNADAQAKAIRVQAEAIKAQGGAEYLQLKAIENWNGQMPSVLGASGNLLYNIPSK